MVNRKQIKSARKSACICAIAFLFISCNDRSEIDFDIESYLQSKITNLTVINNVIIGD